MTRILLRMLAAAMGLLVTLDCVLPAHREILRLTHHSEYRDGDTHYQYLHFEGTRPVRCSVTEDAFRRTADGDQVVVLRNPLSSICAGIMINERSFQRPLLQRFITLCVLALCLGIAFIPQRRKPPRH